VVLLALAGCHNEPPLKPELPEQYVLPPDSDPRFSNPPNYPKDTLDSGNFRKDQQKQNDPNRGGSGFGGPSMGPGGRGMGGY
jgi:hypothetical protein